MKRVVQWIMWSPARLIAVAVTTALLVVGGVYLATRPTASPPPTEASPSQAPGASPSVPEGTGAPSGPPAPPPGAVEGGADLPVPDDVLEPVQTYLTAKENRASANRTAPADWLTDARPVMTADYYEELAAELAAVAGGSLGWEWDEYHDNGWTIEVSDLSCHPHADVYDPAAPETALLCSYDAVLLDVDGGQVYEVPFGWYDDRTALVVVTQADGWWRVSGDSTGQAG